MIRRLYDKFQSWPPGLQAIVIRTLHAVGYAGFTLLASHYYFGDPWGKAFGYSVLTFIAGQHGIQQRVPRDPDARDRVSDPDRRDGAR